jgi:hypothetical protein
MRVAEFRRPPMQLVSTTEPSVTHWSLPKLCSNTHSASSPCMWQAALRSATDLFGNVCAPESPLTAKSPILNVNPSTFLKSTPVDCLLLALLGCHKQDDQHMTKEPSVLTARWSLTYASLLRRCHTFTVEANKTFATPADSMQKSCARRDCFGATSIATCKCERQ